MKTMHGTGIRFICDPFAVKSLNNTISPSINSNSSKRQDKSLEKLAQHGPSGVDFSASSMDISPTAKHLEDVVNVLHNSTQSTKRWNIIPSQINSKPRSFLSLSVLVWKDSCNRLHLCKTCAVYTIERSCIQLNTSSSLGVHLQLFRKTKMQPLALQSNISCKWFASIIELQFHGCGKGWHIM